MAKRQQHTQPKPDARVWPGLLEVFPEKQVVLRDSDLPYNVSDVVAKFAAPYLEEADGHADYYSTYVLVNIAWNLSFFPRHERLRQITTLLPTFPEAVRLQVKQLLARMIERKEEHFAEYRRIIVDFKLVEEADSYHLTIVSQEVDAPAAQDSE